MEERDYTWSPEVELDLVMDNVRAAVFGDIPAFVTHADGRRASKGSDIGKIQKELAGAIEESDGYNMVGYSMVFNQWTRINDQDGEYWERVLPARRPSRSGSVATGSSCSSITATTPSLAASPWRHLEPCGKTSTGCSPGTGCTSRGCSSRCARPCSQVRSGVSRSGSRCRRAATCGRSPAVMVCAVDH